MSKPDPQANRTRHVYTADERAEALRLVRELGSTARAAREVGMPASTLRGWVRRTRAADRAAFQAASIGWPTAREPFYTTSSINERVELCRGHVVIRRGTSTYGGPGTLTLDWLPSPLLRLSFKADSPRIYQECLAPGSWEVGMPHLRLAGTGHVVGVRSGGVTTDVQVVVEQSLLAGDASRIRTIVFHVANLTKMIGGHVRYADGLRGAFTARIELTHEDQLVVLDPICGASALFNAKNAPVGFGITHVGSWHVPPGKTWGADDVAEVLWLAASYLGFCNGSRTGAFLAHGLDESGRTVFRRFDNPVVDPFTSRPKRWVPDRSESALPLAFPGFRRRMIDPFWRRPLQQALEWYRRGNAPEAGQEAPIILVQAALELLAWVVEVEVNQAASRSDFGNLPAAEKLRKVLLRANVDVAIPDALPALRSTAGVGDGPEVFTWIRNRLVHPELKNRRALEQVSGIARHEAKVLGLTYLELLLLWCFEYVGKYQCRWNHQSYPVPWG